MIGWLATAIFLCGAMAQLTVGRLLERLPPHLLFAGVATLQFAGVCMGRPCDRSGAGRGLRDRDGGDLRPDHGRRHRDRPLHGRRLARPVYAVRYFLTFITAGIAVQMIAQLYGRGGGDLVLDSIATTGFIMMAAVYVLAATVHGAEAAHRFAHAPAE